MQLLPRETDKLQIYTIAQLAITKLKSKQRLNIPLTIGLLTFLVLQEIPVSSVSKLMNDARKWIGKDMVMFGVPYCVEMVQVEGTFPDGTKLVTIHHPICEQGDWSRLGLEYIQLPLLDSIIPGEYRLSSAEIEYNKNRKRQLIEVVNSGDRPIQIGSHYPFHLVNSKLIFNRKQTFNFHLDIPSGTSIRFEPGQDQTVQLCSFEVHEVPISIDDATLKANTLSRKEYANLYGPTMGDQIRLGDTDLFLTIEKDHTIYGDECTFGGGKSIRNGQMQSNSSCDNDMDLVITNVIIIDYTGIYKADVGIKDGLVAKIGKSGNPDIGNCDMAITANTDIISGEHMIVTAGGIDTHVHYISLQQCDEALFSGILTLIGGGNGPTTGTCATTCTPGTAVIKMLQETDHLPLNFGFTGKGNSTNIDHLKQQIENGCVGLKLHEDWGSDPLAIDACLTVCKAMDVQCTIHTDTLNESGYLESTVAAFKDRTIHTYHTEGAGGGHAPDCIKLAQYPNIIPSSTNPTRCLTVNTIDEHLDMLICCHHLNRSIKQDLLFAESRIRQSTIAAEDLLQDMGILSIISSDSQAMGRIGEVISRTWQSADKMKKLNTNKLKDNFRIKRYISKYTINPAIAHGISHVVGSIEVGKVADLVLWDPKYFGVKPFMVIKQGRIACSQMGDANASIPTCEPVIMRPQFGYHKNGIAFVSQSSLNNVKNYNLNKPIVPVKHCNSIGKQDMKFNDVIADIQVNSETFEVFVDGRLMTCEPATSVALSTLYQTF